MANTVMKTIITRLGRSPILAFATLGAAAIAFFVIYHPLGSQPDAKNYAEYAAEDPDKIEINYFNVELPIDGSNFRELAGYADDILLGVVSEIGEADDVYGTPSSRVTVNVKHVLKGNYPVGPVVFLAEGGDRKTGDKREIWLPSGGSPIGVDGVYMFAMRHIKTHDSNLLIPRWGQIALTAEEGEYLNTNKGDAGRIGLMREAVANQIPFQH